VFSGLFIYANDAGNEASPESGVNSQ